MWPPPHSPSEQGVNLSPWPSHFNADEGIPIPGRPRKGKRLNEKGRPAAPFSVYGSSDRARYGGVSPKCS